MEYKHKHKAKLKSVEKFKDIHCPKCDAKVDPGQLNIKQLVGKCNSCGTIFSFAEDLPRVDLPNEEYESNKPKVIHLPKGIEIYELSRSLLIDHKWRHSLNPFIVFFTLFWNAIVFFITAVAVADLGLAGMLPIGLHLTVGIGLLYWVIASFLNTTTIAVEDRFIDISHRPIKIPFWKNKQIDLDEIEQIYVEKYSNGSTNGKKTYAYQVKARLRTRNDEVIIKNLSLYEQARFIEQEIEYYLGIQDRKVDEEYEK